MSAKFSKPLYITIILWLLAVVFVSNYNSNVPLEAHHNYRWFNYEVPNHVIDSINRYKQAPIVEHYFAISPPSHLTPEQWGQAQSASAKLKLDSQQGGLYVISSRGNDTWLFFFRAVRDCLTRHSFR